MKLRRIPGYLAFGCAMLAGQGATRSDDDSKETKKKEVVIVQKRSSETLENVKSALDKTDLSDEIKSDVLKKLESALQSSGKTAKSSNGEEKRTARIEIAGSKSDPKDQQEVKVTIIDGDDKNEQDSKDDKPTIQLRKLGNLQGLGEKMRTQVIRPFAAKESYRIGVVCQQANDESETDGKKEGEGHGEGLRIESVIDDSPAASAGIKKGDLLLMVNGKPIHAIHDLTDAIQEAGKNEKDVTLEISRDEKKMSFQLKPKKMTTSDLEMDNINLLNLPKGGFVVDDESMKKWQEFAGKWKGSAPQGFAFAFPGNEDLKKEIDQLKSEIAELKQMIREIANNKK